MSYLPILLEVRGYRCVVIGGGEVGTRRAEALVRKGALVRVITPRATQRIRELAEGRDIELVSRPYQAGDLEGCQLAFAATDNGAVHRQVADEARKRGVLLNVTDCPDLCSFIMPATVERGDFTVAISTGGASPALAAKTREDLERQFGEEYLTAVEILRQLRLALAGLPAEERREKLIRLARAPIPSLLRQRQVAEVEKIIRETVGEAYNLRRLGINLGG